MTSRETLRYRLVIQYDGFPFRGWQIQGTGSTVQGELERVLERITGEHRTVVGSGRTDTGAHALGQVAAVDVPSKWSAVELRRSMNALLPREVWLKEVRRVPSDFHPRFHPRARRYHYFLGTEPDAGSPFHRRWCWDASELAVDSNLLALAAEEIPGDRSFERFAKAGQPHRGTRCHVRSAAWTPWEGLGHRFEITADRYLHHMVRYLVGTMVDVARGRRGVEELRELLGDPDTGLVTSPPAPPEGLFLAGVDYPPEVLGDHPDRDPPGSQSSSKGLA